MKITTEIWVQRAKAVHGNTYGYFNSIYQGQKTNITIDCPEHGPFYQRQDHHVQGQGCPKCQGNVKLTEEDFIDKQNILHKKSYSYGKYTSYTSKIEIRCIKHGVFYQTPQAHLQLQGCPNCSIENKVSNKEQFISQATLAHNNTYEYSDLTYINQTTKVQILCKDHGYFYQLPNNHVYKLQGCPKCQGKDYKILYLLRCLDTGLIKIGIANNLKARIQTIGGNLEFIQEFQLENPRTQESLLHSKYATYRRYNPHVRSGNTEFFVLSEQQVQVIIKELE